ncbi:MAG: MarR family winged helix-turn-helix transcriptional regulator [Desulfobacteraceae bacterium]|jgi:DNA-binding MarR family transcriptional regulator|nr:MarR family winged helix-turn-helix transcriptional regulator [Desulfobacteraceae bacterium]
MKGADVTRNEDAFSPSDAVLAALRKIIRSIELNSRSLVKRVGLTGPQLIILKEVSRMNGSSIGEVARTISLSQATVTGIVERLEKRNLLLRRRSDVDRRKVMVEITQEGETLVRDAPPLMQEAFVDRFSRLPEWEQSMVLSALQLLVQLMDAKSLSESSGLMEEDGDIPVVL